MNGYIRVVKSKPTRKEWQDMMRTSLDLPDIGYAISAGRFDEALESLLKVQIMLKRYSKKFSLASMKPLLRYVKSRKARAAETHFQIFEKAFNKDMDYF